MAVMNNENVIENGAAQEPQDEKNDTGRALLGKIARLPAEIREEVCLRMHNGKTNLDIAAWLNELRPVKEILAALFNSVPINHQNISNWRTTGFKRWLAHQEKIGSMKEIAKEANDFAQAGGNNIARGAAAFASGKIMTFLKEIPDKDATPEELINLATTAANLLKGEHNSMRLTIAHERLRQHERRLILIRDKQQRDVVAIAFRVLGDARAKAAYDAPISNAEKIELIGLAIYGELWEPRPIPTSQPPPSGAKPLQAIANHC